ncbi:MAG: NTP transferase domain-containing protein [Candidatus Methanoperedens sp.]|nr:NTP transferase domain-containing protein [Candidatus Methanoperedens sp.]
MDALVMAGGRGKRLSMDEKPLTLLLGKPLVAYVLEALLGAGNIDRVFVATSPMVGKTIKWLSQFCEINTRVSILKTPGNGFVNDMVQAVEEAGIKDRVFITMADLPLITPELIDRIIGKYHEVNTPALSVHMKLEVCTNLGLRPDTVFHKNGGFIVPCGINILDVEKIREEQEDYNLVLDDEELALNVNTRADLSVSEMVLRKKTHCETPKSL